MSESLREALEALRGAEKGQAMRYRGLAVLAEERGDGAASQRLHDLHADEQHHVSRLTARLIELGHTPAPLPQSAADHGDLAGWEARARGWEGDEVHRYERLLAGELDAATRQLAAGILEVEVHHRDELAGKWTVA